MRDFIERVIGSGFGWTAKVTPWILPGRLLTTCELVALRHPRPVSRGHLLILPRNRSLGLDGSPRETGATVAAMLAAGYHLASGTFDSPADVIAVINGGARQDVRLLHMHLLADAHLAGALRAAERARTYAGDARLTTSEPAQRVHVLYAVDPRTSGSVIADTQRLVAKHTLTAGGYSLMARATEPAFLHLVASDLPAVET